MSNIIHVLLADNHPPTCLGLQSLFDSQNKFRIIGLTNDAADVHRLCLQYRPDILLLSLNLPNASPYDLIADLQQHTPTTKIIILTAKDNDLVVRDLCQSGIAGYILKTEPCERIIEAICAVIDGETWFSKEIIARLIQSPSLEMERYQGPELDVSECETLQRLVTGETDKQIAKALSLSERTLRYRLKTIYDKLG